MYTTSTRQDEIPTCDAEPCTAIRVHHSNYDSDDITGVIHDETTIVCDDGYECEPETCVTTCETLG